MSLAPSCVIQSCDRGGSDPKGGDTGFCPAVEGESVLKLPGLPLQVSVAATWHLAAPSRQCGISGTISSWGGLSRVCGGLGVRRLVREPLCWGGESAVWSLLERGGSRPGALVSEAPFSLGSCPASGAALCWGGQ